LLVLNLLAEQVTAVQPLATAVVQAEQVPPTVAHPASHPSAASLLVSNLFVSQVTAVQPLASAELQAVQEPPSTAAQQLKSSLVEVVANWLAGQVEHEFASPNGLKNGSDM
jgi:hypothetical protein